MKARLVISLLPLILFLTGCSQASKQGDETDRRPSAGTFSQLQLAVQNQDWVQAQALANDVLMQHADDPNALELAARAAHGSGDLQTAADLMSEACVLESFSNEARVQHAMAAQLASGQLFSCMELLEQSLVNHPDRHDLRRRLFQMYWGAEDRVHSLPHAKYLILKRQFDVELLLALSETEQRTESAEPLVQLAARHPRDKRPLIAAARLQIDKGNYALAIETLRQCLSFPAIQPPALALLAQALVADGQDYELIQWVSSVPEEVKAEPRYWMALGDWCREHDRNDEAVRAYWEAAKQDPDFRAAWYKLAQTVQHYGAAKAKLTDEQFYAMEQRVNLLYRFSQLRAEFIKTDKQSQKLAIEMATTLSELGRLWEAEAWASIAMTLPPGDESLPIETVRNSIIARLAKSTPWQVLDSHSELTCDLSHLSLPQINQHSGVSAVPSELNPVIDQPAPHLKLVDEAARRGLRFFGRTGDRLDQPGIKHCQTLGCGGGTIDFDLDGWCDLYLAAAGGTPPALDSSSNSLWRNRDGQFSEVTEPSGAGDLGFGQGVAVGDINEDGFPDILSLNYGPNSLLINNGDGTFKPAGRIFDSGVLSEKWSSSGAIADINSDGLADIVIVNYGAGYEAVVRECKHAVTQVARACSPLVFDGASDNFLLNTPIGELIDVSAAFGMPSVIGRGLGVLVGNLAGDAGIGIFVANDLTSNHYWSAVKPGSSQFAESALPRGLASDDRTPAQGSMGIASGDFDRDGDVDLYVTNFANEPNTFHEQQSPGFWSDRTAARKLLEPTMPLVGFGTQAVDFDNDGALELVVSNGHVDTYPAELNPTPYAQPMLVFWRRPNGQYLSIGDSIEGGYLNQNHVGRALWTIDANRDARLDLVVTHQTEPVALLMNESSSRGDWLDLSLVGTVCSRDAIGSVITVRAGDKSWSFPLVAGDGYLCSNQRGVHCGLGENVHRVAVTVKWADGSLQDFSPLAPNHRWVLVQGDDQAFLIE